MGPHGPKKGEGLGEGDHEQRGRPSESRGVGSQDERVPAHQSQALPPLRPTRKGSLREWKNKRMSCGLCIHSDLGIKRQSCTSQFHSAKGPFFPFLPAPSTQSLRAGAGDSQAHPAPLEAAEPS